MVYVPQLQDVRCVSLLVFAVQFCLFSTDVGWMVDCWWWSESSPIASSKVFISKKHRSTAMDPWLFLIESHFSHFFVGNIIVWMSCHAFLIEKLLFGWLFDHSHFVKVIASCWGDYIFDDAFWDENGYHPQPAGCWIPEVPLPRHIFFWRLMCCSNRMVSERDEDWEKEFGTFLWMLSKGMIFWKMNLFPSESITNWLPGFHCVRDLGTTCWPPQR